MKFSFSLFIGFIFSILSYNVLSAEQQDLVWRYTVRPGDNLIHLGKAYLINPDNWRYVQKLNQIKNPYRIPVGSVLRVPLSLVKQGPASAEVVSVSGDAKLMLSAGASQSIQMGQKLGPGAYLITKDNSKVVIKFADGSLTSMNSNAELILDTMSIYSGGAMVDTKLRLQQGQVETRANPSHATGNKMQIITPSAIAAVRGTVFRVTADEKSVKQETLEGKVSLSAVGEKVMVNKGYGSLVETGKPPIPPMVLLAAANTAQFKTHYDSLPMRFDMPVLEGATAWAGKISPDATFRQVISESEQQGSVLTFADLPDGQYVLSVRAIDKLGIAGYDATHAFTLNARPFQPAPLFPAEEAVVRDDQPELKWNAVADAQFYSLQVASDAGFKNIHTSKRIASTAYKLNSKLSTGQYFWRVASITQDANGQEDQGPTIKLSRFNFKPAPPQPDISQLKVKVSQNKVYVDTIAPLEGLSYQIRLDNERNHQENVWSASGLGQTFSFLLKEYGKQTLRIRQVDSDGTESPEAIYEFDANPQ